MAEPTPDHVHRRTYEREVGVGLLIFWAIFGWAAAYNDHEMGQAMRQFMTPFVFIFAGGAYGMDAWANGMRK